MNSGGIRGVANREGKIKSTQKRREVASGEARNERNESKRP